MMMMTHDDDDDDYDDDAPFMTAMGREVMEQNMAVRIVTTGLGSF